MMSDEDGNCDVYLADGSYFSEDRPEASLASDDLVRPQDFPEDFEGANGHYWNNCECGLTFTGRRSRIKCKICTDKETKTEGSAS